MLLSPSVLQPCVLQWAFTAGKFLVLHIYFLVSCLYQYFISLLQCRVVTVHLNCHRKAQPSRGIHGRDEVCGRKISWPIWKAQTHPPWHLVPFYSKYGSENKLTDTPFHFPSEDLQHQKTSQLQLGNQLAFLALPVWQSLASKSQPERRPNNYRNKQANKQTNQQTNKQMWLWFLDWCMCAGEVLTNILNFMPTLSHWCSIASHKYQPKFLEI